MAIDHTVYMTLDEAIALSRDLADVIDTAGRPDILVGVANGALLPMKTVADELGIRFHVIHLRRKGSRYKQRLYAIKQALGIPTWLLTLRPVRVVQTWFEERTATLEETDDAFAFDVTGKDVMIVDDAIHTGMTARHLKDRLLAKGAANVRIAVICWYRGPTDSGDWSPDLYLHRRYQWYPWSNNSPHFPKFLTWLASKELSFLAMISLLLLDLDGVVVYEMAPPRVKKLELILLHDMLITALQQLGVPVVVLTHRSRAEAAVILRSAGLEGGVAGLIAAEDILHAAFAYGTPWQVLRKGLRKSWALPAIERRHQVDRKNIAFIDDRLDNIEDLVANGVGVALHAPSGIDQDGGLISFDFEQAMRMLREWTGDRTPPILSVAPRIVAEAEWSRTGMSTGTFVTSPFNRARRYGRSLRQMLWRRPAVQHRESASTRAADSL